MFSVFKEEGHRVYHFPFSIHPGEKDSFSEERMEKELDKAGSVDFVFSFNFFPKISMVCEKRKIKYVSWVYDSPYVDLYSYTLINPCNYVFVFDRDFYLEFRNQGIKTVYYLPMGVNLKRLDKLIPSVDARKILDTDIAFVGSLYQEKKHDLYAKYQGISPYSIGYLDGIVDAQRKVYGYNFLQEVLPKDIIREMQAVETNGHNYERGVETEEYIYGDYVLSRRVTALERKEILTMLSEKYQVQIHTNDKTVKLGAAKNMGPTDYYNGMPFVFKTAKINLNITLRSIKSGIPLRAMDIMGCGGFLLSNYQADYLDFFVPDEDFVFYQDYEDLMNKTEYYLNHEKERREVAENGHRKMKEHTLQKRLQVITDIVSGEKRV